MTPKNLEERRRVAYLEAEAAEQAFLSTRSHSAQVRYRTALETLSKIERQWTQVAALNVPLEMGL